MADADASTAYIINAAAKNRGEPFSRPASISDPPERRLPAGVLEGDHTLERGHLKLGQWPPDPLERWCKPVSDERVEVAL